MLVGIKEISRAGSVKLACSYFRKVKGCQDLYERISMGLELFMESNVSCMVSINWDLYVFIEGVIENIERGFCDFS